MWMSASMRDGRGETPMEAVVNGEERANEEKKRRRKEEGRGRN